MKANHFFLISPQGEPVSLSTVDEGLALVKQGGYLWLDFYKPNRDELFALVDQLKIHPLSVEDCLDNEQIPKIEDFPSNTFILFNGYTYLNRALEVDEFDFMLGKDFLVTVNTLATGQIKFHGKLGELTDAECERVRSGPDFLLHVLLDHLIDRKFGAIEKLQDELDRTEEHILKDPAHFKPGRLLNLRRLLLTIRKSLSHEREILVRICRGDSPFISDKSVYHFRDIYDHLTKFFEITEMYREMISSLMEMYLSMINNRMTMVANQTNQVMRRLTLITTIFMPLTLLAGIGGMSEWSMMTGPHNWRITYPLFIILMGLVAAINYLVLKKFETHTRENPWEGIDFHQTD